MAHHGKTHRRPQQQGWPSNQGRSRGGNQATQQRGEGQARDENGRWMDSDDGDRDYQQGGDWSDERSSRYGSDEESGSRVGQYGPSASGYRQVRHTGRGPYGSRDGSYGSGDGGYQRGWQSEPYGSRGYQGGEQYGRSGRYARSDAESWEMDRPSYGDEGGDGYGAPSMGRWRDEREAWRQQQRAEHEGDDRNRMYSAWQLGYGSGSPSYGNRGEHSGRGPKGYRRSDERVTEEVNEALTRHGGVDASEIQVEVTDGEVTLSGTVDNRSAKRMAEDAVQEVSGVREVLNHLRVNRDQSGKESGKRGARASAG